MIILGLLLLVVVLFFARSARKAPVFDERYLGETEEQRIDSIYEINCTDNDLILYESTTPRPRNYGAKKERTYYA